jgi:PAS domain S-box-containing protein
MKQLRCLFRFPNIPLGIVLVVPFVLEVMGAVGLTAYLSYRHGQESINEMGHHLMTEVSDRVDQQLTRYLELPIQVVEQVDTTLNLNPGATQNEPQLGRFLKAQMGFGSQGAPPIDLMLLLDQKNQLTAVENAAPHRWTIYSRNLKTSDQLRSRSLELEGTQQRSLYETKFEATQDPFRAESWYAKLQPPNTGLWQLISLPRVDHSRLLLVYLQPFQPRNPGSRGMIGAAVDLEKIGQFLADLQISPQAQAFIVEPSGALVAASSGEPFSLLQKQRLRNLTSQSLLDVVSPAHQYRLQASRSTNSAIRVAAQHLHSELGGFHQITTKRLLNFEAHGKPYYLQVTPLRHPAQLNWVLVLVVPRADFAAPMEDHSHMLLLLSGGALVAAIALGLLTARQITRPIKRLNRASEQLMLDTLEQPVEEPSWIKELAVVAHSFNKMTEYLSASFDQVKLALQESEEKFTTVFRTSPDPIMITTLPDGKILEVNDSFLRLTGLSREIVLNSTAIELGLWTRLEDRQKLMQFIEVTGRVYNQEVKTVTQRGVALTVLLSSEKIELEGKDCLLTVAKDITERKRLEEALQRSEAKLQDVLNSAAAAICYFYVDEVGKLQSIYFSAGVHTVFGYAPETLLVKPEVWQQRVHPDDWQTVILPSFAQVAAGQSIALEYRYDHPDGTLRWLAADVITRWDTQQNRWLVTTVEFDITARKKAEEALRLSEERFRMAFDSATIGMDIAAPDGRFLKVNPALCQMLGYLEADLLKCSYRDVTHPDDLAIDHAVNLQILRGDVSSQTFEKRFIHQDGQTIWALMSLALVRDFQQEPLYWVAQVQDITVRKQAEEAIRESEARFRAVFETATVGIAIATLNGTIMEANDTFCEISGYDKVEIQQLQLQDLIHPDDLLRWTRLMQHLDLQWLDHHQIKACWIRKNGEFPWVQLTTLLIHDAAHHPLHLVVRIEVLPVTMHPENEDFSEAETR